jgi:HlyD family secretion protein
MASGDRSASILLRKLPVVLVVVVTIFGTWTVFRSPEEKQQTASAALAVTVMTPQQLTVAEYLDVTGTTVERDEVKILTELSDVRVTAIYADVGDGVQKGQRLAMLDGESLGNKQKELRADYERAADAWRRIDALRNVGAISQQKLIETRTAMQTAKAQLADAMLAVRRTVVTAPAAGIITERKATLGALVSADEPLYRIAKEGVIEVEADVPEADISKVTAGGVAAILLSGDTQKRSGSIRLIGRRIDPATRTAKIRIALDHTEDLPVGLFATIRIAIHTVSGLAIPATAIQSDDNGQFVWSVAANNKAERLGVTVIARAGENVIASSLPRNSRVIARAGTFIKEGDEVRVVRVPK